MRAVPAIVVSGQRVGERRDGKSRRDQAEAFRRALQQEAEARPEAGDPAEPATGEAPMRRSLQVPADAGRKTAQTARHVDVIA
jgi:hypothetical protein